MVNIAVWSMIVDLPDREALVRRRAAQLRPARGAPTGGTTASVGIGPRPRGITLAEFVETMLGAYKLRAVPINVNYRYVEDELRYLFDNADLKALVHHRRFTPRIAAVKGEMPLLRHLIAIDDDSGEDPGGAIAMARRRQRVPARSCPALAGRPLCPLHRRHHGHAEGRDVAPGGRDLHARRRHRPRDRDRPSGPRTSRRMTATPTVSMAIAPHARRFAVGDARALFTGTRWCSRGSLLRSRRGLADHREEQVQALMITGDAMGRPLVEALDESTEKRDLASLFLVTSTAAVFSPTVKDDFFRHFPNLIIVDGVGASESGGNGLLLCEGEDAMMAAGPPSSRAPARWCSTTSCACSSRARIASARSRARDTFRSPTTRIP
jgi:fatty-acyl-CoA synthase